MSTTIEAPVVKQQCLDPKVAVGTHASGIQQVLQDDLTRPATLRGMGEDRIDALDKPLQPADDRKKLPTLKWRSILSIRQAQPKHPTPLAHYQSELSPRRLLYSSGRPLCQGCLCHGLGCLPVWSCSRKREEGMGQEHDHVQYVPEYLLALTFEHVKALTPKVW